MANAKRNKEIFYVKPTIAAIAVAFAGPTQASEENTATLPEVKVAAPKEKSTGYKAEKASSSKFTAPLIDTPKSVTVITEDVIRDTGAQTFQDALRTVPGVTFGAAEGGGAIGDRPFIRGFDSEFSTYVDGMRDLGSQSREVFAVERIEVIKGPSGAFDGRGSAGGSVNIVSKLPKAENFVRGTVGLGTDSYKRGTFDVNQVLNDNVAVRVAGLVHDADAPGRDVVDSKRYGIAPSITIGLNSPTSLTASFYHLKTDEMPDWGIPYGRNAAGAVVGRPLSVDRENFYGVKSRDYRKTETDIGTVQFKHAFSDDVVLKNTIRYSSIKNDYAATRPTVPNLAALLAGNVTRGLRGRDAVTDAFANVTDLSVAFNTGSFGHKLNTGVEFSHEETDLHGVNVLNTPAGPGSLYNPNPNDPLADATFSPNKTVSRVITKSAYAFDTIELSKQWLLNLGLRYDDYDATAKTTNQARFGNSQGFWNYQSGIVYKIKPYASVYASYGTSTSPVGMGANSGNQENGNNLAAGNEDLKPERSRSVEIGTKWDVLEDLALTAAIFKTQKTDARVPGAVAGTFTNAGEVEVKGFEVGATGQLTEKLQVFGGYTYLDSEQKNKTAVAGAVGDFGAANNGNEMPGIAKNSASLWTTYYVLPNLKVGGGAFYSDKVYANPANSAYVPSYVRWDAMANYKIDKNLSLQLNLQNLTDKRYYNATYTNHFALIAPGRLAFVSLNFDY